MSKQKITSKPLASASFTLTQRDLRRYYSHFYTTHPLGRVPVIVFVFAIVATSYSAFAPATEGNTVALLMILLVIGLVALVVGLAMVLFMSVLITMLQKHKLGNYTVTLRDNGIVERGPNGQTEREWGQLKLARSAKSAIYVFSGISEAYIIPHHAFKHETAMTNFQQICKSKINSSR